MATRTIWTVGHGRLELAELAAVLALAGIDVVVDVRSQPDATIPRFHHQPLRDALGARGVEVRADPRLGGRPLHPDLYDADGHVDYAALSQREDFTAALDELECLAVHRRVALLCAELHPTGCHRRLLVGRALTQRGWHLEHLTPTGSHGEDRIAELDGDGQLFAPPWRSIHPIRRPGT